MFSSRHTPCRQEASDRHERWHQENIRSAAEMPGVIDVVVALMEAQRYPPKDLFGVRLVLEEAVVNGVKHGNGNDPLKQVHVRYRVTPDQVEVEVEDEGPGFDPAKVPDPRADENLEKPSGRGLLLMRHYLTSVTYNARGNCVTLCKRRTGA